jgi:hypothetical protein
MKTLKAKANGLKKIGKKSELRAARAKESSDK